MQSYVLLGLTRVSLTQNGIYSEKFAAVEPKKQFPHWKLQFINK